jgi:hypothetical protein
MPTHDIFLFEGIQALYPGVSEVFSAVGHPSAEIYIAPQSAVFVSVSIVPQLSSTAFAVFLQRIYNLFYFAGQNMLQ